MNACEYLHEILTAQWIYNNINSTRDARMRANVTIRYFLQVAHCLVSNWGPELYKTLGHNPISCATQTFSRKLLSRHIFVGKYLLRCHLKMFFNIKCTTVDKAPNDPVHVLNRLYDLWINFVFFFIRPFVLFYFVIYDLNCLNFCSIVFHIVMVFLMVSMLSNHIIPKIMTSITLYRYIFQFITKTEIARFTLAPISCVIMFQFFNFVALSAN